jgi:hypothetical protein
MATSYDYFRVELGDFDAAILDTTIDMCLANATQELLKLIGQTITDEYILGLMAASIYCRGKVSGANISTGGLTEWKVGDVTEKYGMNQMKETLSSINNKLNEILSATYGCSAIGIDMTVGDLEYGTLLNDKDI